MVVLSWCWRGPRRQALRDLRKGLGISSEGGNTGRRTDWPCHINIAKKVRLLRPSVQLPAGIHGWRGLYGFWPLWQAKAASKTAPFGRKIAPRLDTAVRRSVFRPEFEGLERSGSADDGSIYFSGAGLAGRRHGQGARRGIS